MVSSIVTTVLFAFAGLSNASPIAEGRAAEHRKRDFVVKSSRHTPRKWHRHGDAPDSHVLNMQFGLKQSKMDSLLARLNEVSEPKHERYGQHLSATEVNALIQPSVETQDLVSAWLGEHGVRPQDLKFSPSGDWITVSLPVHKANLLLNTQYGIFEHEEHGSQLVRAPEWSLPEYLLDHIDVIEPTNSFLRPMQKSPNKISKFKSFVSGVHEDVSEVLRAQLAAADNSTGPTECDTHLVTPGCLRSLYNTIDYEVQAADKNRMSIANYLGELNIRSDVKQYLQQFRPEAVAAADEFALISINGGTVEQTLNATQIEDSTGVEGALDVQSMLGIAWPTKMISYSTGGEQPGFIPSNSTPTNTNEPYLTWLQYMLNLGDDEIPYVVSTSYADDEQSVSPEYAKRVCESFAQLGARGVSVFFASGDAGVGANPDCLSNVPPYAPQFLPEFPSSCPYVTTVGGTYQFTPEVAAYDPRFKVPFTSGGGFSNLFPRPDYQKDVVDKYLANNNNFPQYAGLFNPAGRAYPDVAAQSINFTVVYNSKVIPVDGTSAATPAFSAVMALVNDALIAAGKPTLGFMNPWLYGGGLEAFTDITSGSSAGCGGEGFPAQDGWDAVTGFGTPDFKKIVGQLGIEVKGWRGEEGHEGGPER